MIQINKGYYLLAAVSPTHNQVLLRMKVQGLNCDLLFQGVQQIEMPFRIDLESIALDGEWIVLNGKEAQGRIKAKKLLTQENTLTGFESSIPSDREPTLTESDIAHMVALGEAGEMEALANLWPSDDWEVLVDIRNP